MKRRPVMAGSFRRSRWADAVAIVSVAVERAAEALGANRASWRRVKSSRGRDLKLVADVASEALLLEALRPSGLPVLSEEAGAGAGWSAAAPYWVVDPLDGSFNHQRGFPMACISVALMEEGQPVVGVIHDLGTGTTAVGASDVGAFEAGRPLQVSATRRWNEAALATGFPVARSYAPAALSRFVRTVRRAKKIRMLGTAGMSLLTVARGVFDAYCEEDIWLWDVAGGLALVAAAGGRVVLRPGRLPHQVRAYAGNAHLPPLFTNRK